MSELHRARRSQLERQTSRLVEALKRIEPPDSACSTGLEVLSCLTSLVVHVNELVGGALQ